MGTRESIDGGDEPVASPWQGLDVARAIGGVAENLAKAGDGGVNAMLEIDENVARPELLTDFLARDELGRALEQHEEDLEGLLLHADAGTTLAEFTGADVRLKNPESDKAWPQRARALHAE